MNRLHYLRYIVSGGVATGITLGLLFVLTNFFLMWYVLAASLSYGAGFAASFLLQKFWTFRDRETNRIHHQALLYCLVGVANIFVNGFLMYLLVDVWYRTWMGAAPTNWVVSGMQIIAAAIIAVESYLVYRFIIFKSPEENHETELTS